MEIDAQFESRKKDHVRIALMPEAQASVSNGLDEVRLIHEAIPDIAFNDVNITKKVFGHRFNSPIFVSSMTGGYDNSFYINSKLAEMCATKNWLLGTGSQRKELASVEAQKEWKLITSQHPKLKVVSNIGITQLLQYRPKEILKIAENIKSLALFVHTNPLQEALQKEGTPNFKGALNALKELAKASPVPVILKEVGSGFSTETLARLNNCGLYAVDVSGLGGTHWGRIEGLRNQSDDIRFKSAITFKNWGISTKQSLLNTKKVPINYKIWSSGGVRNGLDAAKLIAMGSEMVGMAKPILECVMNPNEKLDLFFDQLEYELKLSLFVTGCKSIDELFDNKKVVEWT